MTKTEFHKKWIADESITFDDIAKCAVDWGIASYPKTCRIDVIRYKVLKAAGCPDAEDYRPEEDE